MALCFKEIYRCYYQQKVNDQSKRGVTQSSECRNEMTVDQYEGDKSQDVILFVFSTIRNGSLRDRQHVVDLRNSKGSDWIKIFRLFDQMFS